MDCRGEPLLVKSNLNVSILLGTLHRDKLRIYDELVGCRSKDTIYDPIGSNDHL